MNQMVRKRRTNYIIIALIFAIIVLSNPACAAPSLTSPTNGGSTSFSYPPFYADITFVWQDVGVNTKLEISQDSTFSNVFYSEESSDNTATVSLPAGKYYWRVAQFENSINSYGSWSSTYSYTITASSVVSGTGVQGTIYKSSTLGEWNYINGATVTVYNDTFTTQKVTGNSGYYQVTGLSNGTYYITVDCNGYDTTPTYAVNVETSSVSIQDITMQPEQTYFAPHYVKFVIKEKSFLGILKTPVEGATVNVYENGGSKEIGSQITGSDGAVVFELAENVRYRISVINEGETQTEYLTPSEITYEIIWEDDKEEGTIPENQFYQVCNISIEKEPVNSTYGRIDIKYRDSLKQTNAAYFTVVKTYTNGTSETIDTSEILAGNGSVVLYVPDYKGETFKVIAYIDHESFGELTKYFSVTFPSSNLPYEGKSMAYLAMVVMFFVGGMFGRGDIGYSGILVSGFGWFFWYLDVFSGFGETANGTIMTGLIFATILSIMIIFNERRSEGGI